MIRYISAIAAAFLATASTAKAQDCNGLLDTTISPVPFNAAVELLQSAPLTKDEFETTASFQARVSAAQQGLPSQIAINADLDKTQIVYNADSQKFVVNARAFGSEYGIDWFTALYSAPTKPEGYTLGSTTVGIAVSSSDEVTGSRQAQNAYGATWEVVEIDRKVDAIFDGVTSRYDTKLFGRGLSTDFKWEIPIPAAGARQFKDALKAAFIVTPKAPFYIESTQSSGGRITIQNPRDVTQHARVIVADIKCAVLTNAEGYVLMAITTN